MEKEIEIIKKIYLETTPPLTSDEGFLDVLERIKHRKNKIPTNYKRSLIFLSLLFIVAITAGIFLMNSEDVTLDAVKAATEKAYNSITKTDFKIPNATLKSIKIKATPTLTPTPTIKKGKTILPKSERSNNINTSEDDDNNLENSRNVKGASIEPTRKPEIEKNNNSGHGNSDDKSENNSENDESSSSSRREDESEED